MQGFAISTEATTVAARTIAALLAVRDAVIAPLITGIRPTTTGPSTR